MEHKFRLVTFAAGPTIWSRSLKRFLNQARASGYFSSIDVYTDRSLQNLDPTFFAQHQEFLRANQRGFGYWLWKPWAISRSLERLSAGELGVVYVDVGCTINVTKLSRVRMSDYFALAIDQGNLFFRLNGNNKIKNWVKRDLQIDFGLSSEQMEKNCLVGGILFFTDSPDSKSILNAWLNKAVEGNYRFLDDSASRHKNEPTFQEHRHDQAILTCLAEELGIQTIPDETYFQEGWRVTAKDFPIWATRLKSGFKSVSDTPLWKIIRKVEQILFSRRRESK